MTETKAIPARDREILRELGKKHAGLAALPANAEKAALWRKLNRLERTRPLIYINEIPWGEMTAGGELDLECEDEWCRRLEWHFREIAYRWSHMRVDMVVSPVLYSPFIFHSTGYGITQDAVEPDHYFGARAYKPLIHTERDVEKIRTPEITADWEATERRYARMQDVFDGIVPVVKRGVFTHLCNPWDFLIQVYGIERMLEDMIEQPGLVHAAIRRFMEATHAALDQIEKLGLVSLSDGNHMVGTSTLAFSDQMPQSAAQAGPARFKDIWGYAMSQIFSPVSPAMHEEFALKYERPYLERFGLSGYGCCDPLHHKIGILRSVKNLRMISMSPWVDVEAGARNIGADYVFAYKPNPALVAMEGWNPGLVEKELRGVFEKTRGCRIAAVLKDISTCNRDPRRLWEWCDVAMRVAEEFA